VRIAIGHESRGAGIVLGAQRSRADVVVMGVAAQDVSGRPFLGQTAEHVLQTFDGSIVIVAIGPQ
jgi:nucleotide-binding universal stress UspA family protein